MDQDSRYRELISTERSVRLNQWQGPQWRRWRMEGAQISEAFM